MTKADHNTLHTRESAEQLEFQLLREQACFSARAFARPQNEAPDPYRTCFVRDRDRVLHCGAFRRLKDKTQVFVVDQDDFYRTRLTHTLEVTQIARFLARALRLNDSLAEVLALVHDIGHPPFGHEGERILAQISGVPFDHNSQALRIVDVLEAPYPDRRGLNLTQLVRRMILKHGGEAGWGAEPTRGHVLEAQLTDLADSIAYQHHDLEDGLRAGVLHREQLDELPIWREAAERAGQLPEGPEGRKAVLNAMLKTSLNDLIDTSHAAIERLSDMPSEEIAQRGHKPLAFSPERAARHAELMGFLYERFYLSPTVVSSREVAEEALSEIVSHYQQRPGALPLAYRRRLESQGLARTVCDYAAGMTDRYALDAWRRLVEQRLARGPVDDRTLDHRAEGDASDEQQLGHGAEGDAPDEQLAGHGSTPATDDGETAAPTPLDTEMEAAVASLCERIGHGFVDAGLAAMALTHASARSASRPPNERLEFLGDAVLGMVVVRECYLRFPTLPEGELSRIKATTVNRHALHAVAERWALRPLLRLGQGFREGDKVPHSIVADAVEAVLGAVYLDGGMSAADALIRREFGAQIDLAAEGHRGSNAKSELQTFTQGRLGLTPNYRLLDESGPDHAKLFTVAAMLGHRELAVGRGRNKRQAEQRAAQRALRLLMAEASEDRPPLPVDPADRQDHGARPD